jgi:hypothetical protein
MESNPVPVLEQAYPMIVLDPAATGDDPAAPNVRLSLLLGTLAGGILGLGAAVVTDRRVGPRPARRAARSLA